MPSHPRIDRGHLIGLGTAPLADCQCGAEPSLAKLLPGERVCVGGREIMVRRSGTVKPGQPVAVYLHGLAGSSANFNRLAPMLTNHAPGLAIDLLGAGFSDPPAGRYSIIADAQMVIEVIGQYLPDCPIHLVGNSFGGMVATWAAARLGHQVASLTLLAPAVPDLRLSRDRGGDVRLGLLMVPGVQRYALRQLAAVDTADRIVGTLQTCFAQPTRVSAAELADAVAEQRRRDQLDWGLPSIVGQVKALIRSYFRPARWSYWAAARQVSAPTLVVWGLQDRLVDPRLSLKTAAAFARGQLLLIDDCGHLPHMEQATVTARALAALWGSCPQVSVPSAISGTGYGTLGW